MQLATNAHPRTSVFTYGGLFVVTLSTLMYEIALTRIFSVTAWYHFAFAAVSLALFGMTVGALAVYLLPERFRLESTRAHLWVFSLLFAVAIAVCFIIQLQIPFRPKLDERGITVVLTCVVISIPFILSGIVVCLALTRFPARLNRLYGADLAGAAAGCFLLVLLLARVDAPSGVVIVGAIAAIGALLFALDARSRTGIALALVALAALGGLGGANAALHRNHQPLLRIMWSPFGREPLHDYERWNAFSRVTVDGDPDRLTRPSGYGLSPVAPETRNYRQLVMIIDLIAGTPLVGYTGNPDESDFLRYDVTNIAHYIRNDGDVLVIGVGGGRDVLAALEFEQRSVTGLEINPSVLWFTLDKFGDYTGHLDDDPRVRIVNDEARSWITRNDQRFDIIQITLIDTFAASSAGAYALTENGLYTTEAWHTFFDHLQPNGVLSVTRWHSLYGGKPIETWRSVALAAQTLKERGVENPRQHILLYAAPSGLLGSRPGTLLVSPDPFTPEDFETIRAEMDRLQFQPVLTPDFAADSVFEGLVSPDGPDAAVDSVKEDISPPTDDRPFFFLAADFESFFNGTVFDDTYLLEPVLALGILAPTVMILSVLFIIVPLLLTRRRTRAAGNGHTAFYAYFAAIGLAFLLVEVSQLQRFSIFLGHPTYALTVVLFSLLLSSGIGSMLSERFIRHDRPLTLLAPVLALLLALGAFALFAPAALDAAESETTPLRIALAVGLLSSVGIIMGMPFPIGMRLASSRPGTPTEFLWGINGAMSVCASVLGTVIALFWGISIALWVGIVFYVFAAAALVVLTRAPATAVQPLPVAVSDVPSS
jgi:predicted membrane-bound spermidine synthase